MFFAKVIATAVGGVAFAAFFFATVAARGAYFVAASNATCTTFVVIDAFIAVFAAQGFVAIFGVIAIGGRIFLA